jgi:PAS domain S-box-containing protein
MKDTEKSVAYSEEELQGKEGGRRSVIHTLIDSMTLVNKSYVYEFVSEAYCQAHGRSKKDIVGSSVADILGRANFNGFIKKRLDQCFAGNVVRYEKWLESPGQGRKYYRVAYSPYFNHDGEVTHAVVASQDITDLKKEEEALDKSEPVFRTVLKSMHYGVYIFDTEGNFTFVNDVAVQRSGYPREWYLGRSLLDLARGEQKDVIKRHFEATLRGERLPPYEFASRTASDKTAWIHISTTAIRESGRVVGVLGLLLDVTKRKNSEMALKESEERYRTLFHESRDAIFITTREGKLVDVNRSFLSLFGYTEKEAKKLDVLDTYANPEDRKGYVEAIEKKGFVENFEVKLKKKDGTTMDCLLTGTMQRDSEGNIRGYQGIIRDETERRRVEAALKDSEEKLGSILHGSPIPQFVIDRNHRVTHWNKALEALTGVKAEDVIGTKHHWKAFYAAERPCIADLLVDEAVAEMGNWYGVKFGASNIVDGAYKATDFFRAMGDRGKWLHFTAAVIRDSKNEIVGAVETLEDITQYRLASDELQKMTTKEKKSEKT